MSDYQSSARRVISIEAQAITELNKRIDGKFSQACDAIMACSGRVVVMGMGKSGHIGSKIAATLASTGTAAFFVHPGEASHGDLGMITRSDVVIALSNSGTTSELLALLPVIKRKGVPLISMTGNDESSLAQFADVNLDVSVREEACPLGLAPTASTTAALVMGDALAVALLEARGFTSEDFALSHPGGALGRKLLLLVENVMRTDEAIPSVSQDSTISEALIEMSAKGLGMTAVVSPDLTLIGVFTDGDLRRSIDTESDLKNTPVTSVMTTRCKTATPHLLAAEAVKIMDDNNIHALIVVDEAQRPVGALNVHDLLHAGVM
ncbi:MAG: KpsF/GutQ family sugar-phosphate isomerase [Gammaproteobacteria bacterium]|nr:KpsF/GutQ family sugar-phosphate isomerase [Gammaproteobacteria bacterium]